MCFLNLSLTRLIRLTSMLDIKAIICLMVLREQAEKLGLWTNTTPEANLAKLITFCALEPLPDCYAPVNPMNSPLVNFLLLKRLHRRILATNEGMLIYRAVLIFRLWKNWHI